MKKRAVIFDMDGVLVDSEPVYIQSFRDFLNRHGGKADESTLNKIAGASAKRTWELVAQMWHEPISPEKVRGIYKGEQPEFLIPYREIMFPGIEELLGFLKEKGMILAVASSSSQASIQRMLEETGIKSYFSHVVSGEMFRESKPHPEIYLYTLSCLGLPADDCLAVEDSAYGIQAAKNAGLEVAAVKDTRFSYDQSGADIWIERTADLRKLFEET